MLGHGVLGRGLPRPGSLQTFSEYRETEARNATKSLVANTGEILEYETLELRIHPPNVAVDNNAHPTRTVITVDSANRPGTLVEVVQHLTELGLRIHKARISSDGGWFVDSFEVSEGGGDGETKVRNSRKLESVAGMLSVTAHDDECANGDETDDEGKVETTVFELAGEDTHGLLADVTQLLTTNGCDVRSAAVWTHRSRVAFVVSVTEKGAAVGDAFKLQRLQQLLTVMMGGSGDGIVNIHKVKGEIHHDRRLHRLLLVEETHELQRRLSGSGEAGDEAGAADTATPAIVDIASTTPFDGAVPATACTAAAGGGGSGAGHGGSSSSGAARRSGGGVAGRSGAPAPAGSGEGDDVLMLFRSPKHSKPEVEVSYCNLTGYWLVAISCKDRSKLLFDSVCTLADLDYDVYHATIDTEKGHATQEYYVRPRVAGKGWDARRAVELRGVLESSIQRRFPKGLKVHVHSVDRFGCLAAVTRVLKSAGLTVTRAKVKTFAANNSSGHTFYVMDKSGGPPDRRLVEAACTEIGGKLVEAGEEDKLPDSSGSHKFSFSFLHRQWAKGWGGSPGSSVGSQ